MRIEFGQQFDTRGRLSRFLWRRWVRLWAWLAHRFEWCWADTYMEFCSGFSLAGSVREQFTRVAANGRICKARSGEPLPGGLSGQCWCRQFEGGELYREEVGS